MAKMKCKCGEILSNRLTPNDVELTVYTDKEWCEILEKDIINTLDIPHPNYDVWYCSKCERIYVFKHGKNEPVKIYKLEV